MWLRETAFFTCCAFTLTLGIFPGKPAQAAASAAVEIQAALPADFSALRLPAELGIIDDLYRGSSTGRVILLQDAHAIPDAQRSIRKAILYFYKQYGVSRVALEGVAAPLDARMLKSFPDKDLLNKVLEDYFDRGELAGGTAAAISGIREEDHSAHGTRLRFQGLEDWPVYEEALELYLAAMEKEGEILKELEAASLQLEEEKKKNYSSELRKVDTALVDFRENKNDFLKTLEILAAVQQPEAGSALALLLEENRKQGSDQSAVETEVRGMGEKIRKAVNRSSLVSGEKKMELNRHFQAFQTGQLSAQAFALFLQEFAGAQALSGPLRAAFSRLSHLAGNQQRLRDIEGTKLFGDFERYAQSVKDALFQSDTERGLDRHDRRLWLAAKLAKLEIRHEDWEEIKSWKLETGNLKEEPLRTLFKYHFAFYGNSERRDGIFFKNLQSFLEISKSPVANHPSNSAVLLVVGGFHAHGLCRLLREKGISYARVMPAIKKLPEQSSYREQMRGEVSWKNYFQVKDGKVNLYEAFMRGTRDRLLEISRESPLLLKHWRDQILRDLSEEGRIEKAGEYTRFLDEINGDEGEKAVQKRLAQVDKFLEDLKGLEARGRFNAANIARLLNPATTAQVTGYGATISPDNAAVDARALGLLAAAPAIKAAAKSEVRTGLNRRDFMIEVGDRTGGVAMARLNIFSFASSWTEAGQVPAEIRQAIQAAGDKVFGSLFPVYRYEDILDGHVLNEVVSQEEGIQLFFPLQKAEADLKLKTAEILEQAVVSSGSLAEAAAKFSKIQGAASVIIEGMQSPGFAQTVLQLIRSAETAGEAAPKDYTQAAEREGLKIKEAREMLKDHESEFERLSAQRQNLEKELKALSASKKRLDQEADPMGADTEALYEAAAKIRQIEQDLKNLNGQIQKVGLKSDAARRRLNEMSLKTTVWDRGSLKQQYSDALRKARALAGNFVKRGGEISPEEAKSFLSELFELIGRQDLAAAGSGFNVERENERAHSFSITLKEDGRNLLVVYADGQEYASLGLMESQVARSARRGRAQSKGGPDMSLGIQPTIETAVKTMIQAYKRRSEMRSVPAAAVPAALDRALTPPAERLAAFVLKDAPADAVFWDSLAKELADIRKEAVAQNKDVDVAMITGIIRGKVHEFVQKSVKTSANIRAEAVEIYLRSMVEAVLSLKLEDGFVLGLKLVSADNVLGMAQTAQAVAGLIKQARLKKLIPIGTTRQDRDRFMQELGRQGVSSQDFHMGEPVKGEESIREAMLEFGQTELPELVDGPAAESSNGIVAQIGVAAGPQSADLTGADLIQLQTAVWQTQAGAAPAVALGAKDGWNAAQRLRKNLHAALIRNLRKVMAVKEADMDKLSDVLEPVGSGRSFNVAQDKVLSLLQFISQSIETSQKAAASA